MTLIVRTVLHAVIVPGTVVVAIPYLLLSSGLELYAIPSSLLRRLGGLSVLVGIVLGLWCTWHFLVLGRGTPNPLDPPKFLVGAGPYRIVRNPMYVSLAFILAGEALVVGSITLAIYVLIMMLMTHLVVVLYEEPTLRRLFGSAYEEYCEDVPRWVPGTVS
jgi:protein-S-isoprenylcysteine O-methyltransferase Ste14